MKHMFQQVLFIFFGKFIIVVDNYDVTMGLGDHRQLCLTVMDTAGQEDFKHIRIIALQGADVCIICYTCTDENSLDNAKSTWITEVKSIDQGKRFHFLFTSF